MGYSFMTTGSTVIHAYARVQTGRWMVMLLLVLLGLARVTAFPEYQTFVQKHSGRPVNCAQCHINPDGPTGTDVGQIGSLKGDDLDRLNQSRTALKPGQDINNPILNTFGNKIIQTVGAQKVMDLRSNPAALAPALNQTSDLDGDGIPDAQEYLAGTDALDKMSGEPGKLFVINLLRKRGTLLAIALVLGLLLAGLRCLILGYQQNMIAVETPADKLTPVTESLPLVIPDEEPAYRGTLEVAKRTS